MPVRLVVFDLDGTVVHGETTAETLARAVGHGQRMTELARMDIRDSPELAAYLTEMASWFAGKPLEEVTEALAGCQLAPGAQDAFQLLHTNHVQTAIASQGWEFGVAWFAKRFSTSHWMGTRLLSDGRVENAFAEDKARFVQSLLKEKSLSTNEVAAVGDSWGDVPMLLAVGHPFYVGKRLPPEIASAHHHADGNLLSVAQDILRR